MKHNWYEEQRARQEAARRARRRRDEVVTFLVNVAICVAALIALFVVMANAFHRPVRERAAYLEGRWGVDHATAMRFAEEEVKDGWKVKVRGEGERWNVKPFEVAEVR